VIIKCIPIKLLKLACCTVLVRYNIVYE